MGYKFNSSRSKFHPRNNSTVNDHRKTILFEYFFMYDSNMNSDLGAR